MFKKLDKTTIIVLCLLALTAVLLVIFMIYIVDRSSEQVTEIKNTKVLGPGENLASAIGSEDDLINMRIKDENSVHPSCTVTDGTIKEAMFHKIAQIKNLRELTLKRCDFKCADFHILSNSRIEVVRIDNGKVDEECLESIGKFPLIQLIELSSCDLSPHTLAHLNGSGVRWLQLRYCQNISTDSNFTADDLNALTDLKNVTFLELEQSKFAPGAFRALNKCTAVALNVERCDLNDDDVMEIAKMPRLSYLNLARNPKITCKGLKAVLNMKAIRQIKFTDDISKCAFTPDERKKVGPQKLNLPDYLWQRFRQE